jgi:hypothetical protein
MTLARSALVDALVGVLPADVDVEGYARLNLSTISRPRVLIRLDEVRPEVSSQGHRRYTFAVVLVTPLTETPAADDQLDALLEDVLFALESLTTVGFESATRAVFDATETPCYELRCYMICPKPDPTPTP